MNKVRFSALEVYGVTYAGGRAVVCGDSEARFFSIFGRLHDTRGRAQYICVGDFMSREAAELVMELLGTHDESDT
jgi:hypothetical protein